MKNDKDKWHLHVIRTFNFSDYFQISEAQENLSEVVISRFHYLLINSDLPIGNEARTKE